MQEPNQIEKNKFLDDLKRAKESVQDIGKELGIDSTDLNILPAINVEDILSKASGNKLLSNEEREKVIAERAAKKRKEVNIVKKESGIKNIKQSKFPTRSNTYLKPGLRAIHLVMHDGIHYYDNEDYPYKHGADFTYRAIEGARHWGKECKKNAFEHLVSLQNNIRENIGKNSLDYPRWILISLSTSVLMDKDILDRLDELKEHTHCAGAYGFLTINDKGRFFEQNVQENTRGCYVQGDLTSTKWDYIVGHKFRDADKYRTICVHGPFIAIRGNTFMNIDFSHMARKTKFGFFHFMADISMECATRGYMVASIKTLCQQYDKINNYFNTPEFKIDQEVFFSKWKSKFPISIATQSAR